MKSKLRRKSQAVLLMIIAGLSSCAVGNDDEPRAVSPSALAVDVWEKPATSGPSDCGYSFADLDVTRIKQDSEWLYVELRHVSPAKEAGGSAMPTVEQVASDGVSTKINGIAGLLAQGGTGWVAVPATRLPIGQFELVFGGFGRKTTVPLNKTPNGMAILPSTARNGVKWEPGSVGVEVGNSAHVEVN